MRKLGVAILLFGAMISTNGCLPHPRNLVQKPQTKPNLLQARQGFKTKLLRQDKENTPIPVPPKRLFQIVQYPTTIGKMAAYLSVPPQDGKKHPAIIWIAGGFGNGIGSTPWEPQTPDNDQSASAFRKAGIIMMYPSFRGGNKNPGVQEGFFGEVNDVIAAAQYLAKHPSVDPKRIYLGGHSTGGTLALLAAEATSSFRAVFAFGPVISVGGYGAEHLPFDTANEKELELRAPILYLHAIANPTFVFEGEADGNGDSLQMLIETSENSAFHGHIIRGVDHFSVLAPITPLIAKKFLQTRAQTAISRSHPVNWRDKSTEHAKVLLKSR